MGDSLRTRTTRRELLGRGLTVAAAGATANLLAPRPAGAAGGLPVHRRPVRRPVPLPTAAQVRAEFTKMVEFGPRLTASGPHSRYIDWLEQQFTDAGLHMLPRDNYTTDRWLVQRIGLDVLSGRSAGPVKIATYYPRSQETPLSGVTGPLVYGGTAPVPSVSFTDLAATRASLAAYPSQLRSWAGGIPSLLGGGPQGSILLIDLPVPAPMTAGALMPDSTYRYWPGHTFADWATSDYKRLWIEPGLSIPLAPFQEIGAIGVVFIVDASYEALKGGYLPFAHGFEPLPALYVDRDTGERLREQAASRPETRLTLTATRGNASTQAVTAVLPGRSDEVLIFNTHTDGQGFVEENAGVAFTQLARHFASLPAGKRLRRTLVFAAWPGHMVADLPQTQGWIDQHPNLVARAAAALTVEHLGCTEWTDSLGAGYQPTHRPEMLAVWTTQGEMFRQTRNTVIAHKLARTVLMRPPAQLGVGGAFQSAGVPQIGAIAGPEYLLTIAPKGDLDKLDEHLAARQIGWVADLARKLDAIPASRLRQGDPTLGAAAP